MASSRRTAAIAAGLVAPATFDASLMPRSAVQQGLVTALSALSTFGAVRATQAIVLGTVDLASGPGGASRGTRMAAQAATLAAAVGARAALARRSSLGRSAVRTLAYETALGAGAALAADGLGLGGTSEAPARAVLGDVATVAAAAVAGAALDLPARRQAGLPALDGPGLKASGTALAVAAGTAVATLTLASVEQYFSRAAGRALGRALPGEARMWTVVGQVTVGGAALVGAVRAIDAVLARIEQAAEADEAGIDRAPHDPFVSGGPASRVSFESLSREGRRHVLTRVRATTVEDVLGVTAQAEPVRVYVGLESAPTVEERVQLALDEVDRLAALDRSLLVLISPTGSGYVNYAALQAVELLARGDVSSIVLQYCLRPSFLSLDHVAVGREQNAMLWTVLARRIADLPADRRPRVVMFGESLGAHTSQDVAVHQGTDGLRVLGVDAAVWIGTPFASRWKDEVLGPPRPDVDARAVGVFDSFDDYLALPQESRDAVRYAMVTHYEDGVPKFGAPVAVQEPAWIAHRDPRDPTPVMRWRPLVTFFQVFVDMLNGSNVTPGVFAALGHDYRADLLDFLHAVYRLEAAPEQVEAIRAALPRFEQTLFDYLDATKAAEGGA